jgi:hypothetical protein
LTLILLVTLGLVFYAFYAIADELRMQVLERGFQPVPIESPRATPAPITEINRLPDLTITRLSVSPARIRSGEKAMLTAQVKNSGTVVLHNIIIRFINTKTGTMLGEERLSIGGGQHKQSTITALIEGSGMTTIQAIVDPLHRVKEANEKNNSAETVLHFIAATLRQPSGPPSVKSPQKAGNIDNSAKSNLFIPKVSLYTNDTGAPEPPPGGNAWGFDFSCFVHLENGFHNVNTEKPVIYFKAKNNALQNAPAFYVGLGKKQSAKIGHSGTWMSLYRVPAGGIQSGKWLYASLKLPPGITEDTDLVVAVDINNEVSETIETNNYSETFRVKFFQPNLPAKTADLVCFPETTNGVFFGDGKGVKVLVTNNGQSDSAPCTIGVGFKDQVLKGSNIKWVGKATVPKIFSHQHVYVTVPGQFQNLPADHLYIVAVDIDDEIDEQGHEDNNLSKPFKYNISSGVKATLPPQDKPFEAFDIIKPEQGDSLAAGTDIDIQWYPTDQLNNLPAAEQANYYEVDIYLVNSINGVVVADLVKSARNQPINGIHSWQVTLPQNIVAGDYRFRFSTPLGSGWGKSGSFTVYTGKSAKAALSNNKQGVGKPPLTSQEVEKKDLSPSEVDTKALKFSLWRIKSIVPQTVVLNGAYGNYARLTSIKVVIEYESNKPFKFAASLNPPKDLASDSIWSLAVPNIRVAGGLAEKSQISMIHGAHSIAGGGFVDPTDSYPWESSYGIGIGLHAFKYPTGVLPKGKNSFTLELDEAGVAHGLKVVGRVLKWEDYYEGVKIKKKSYYAKCTKAYYPHFCVDVGVGVYRGGWSSSKSYFHDMMTYGFINPPAWQHLDPWENTYFGKDQTSIGIPTFSITDCE